MPPEAKIDRAELERLARGLASYVHDHYKGRVGVTLLVFEFGENKNLAYASTAERPLTIEALKEFLANNEAGLYTDPPGPRAKG